MDKKSVLFVYVALVAAAFLARPAAGADLRTGGLTSLSFYAVQGTDPLGQVFIVSSSDSSIALNLTVTASTNQGGSWLGTVPYYDFLLGPNRGVAVKVNSKSLAVGDYAGQVTVSQSGFANSPLRVTVSLKVFPPGAYLKPSVDVLNVSAATGSDASSAYLAIQNLGTTRVTPTFSETTANGGDWLALSAPMASTLSPEFTLRVDFRSSTLAPGFYTGIITATAGGALNSPVNVPVNLRVGNAAGPTLALNPGSLSFTAGLGENPPPVTFAINNSGQGTLAAHVSSSASWLTVSLGSPGAGGSVTATATVDITGLAKSDYTGAITITDPSATNSPQTLAVTLSVRDPRPVLALRSNSVGFALPVGSFRTSGTVDVANAGIGPLNFTAAASTESGGNWLSVTPLSGRAPATLTIAVDSTNLSAGIYKGKVTVTAPDAGAPQEIAVTFGVGVRQPLVNTGGIVNGASFTSRVVAPGEIVSVFGQEFGPSDGVQAGFVGGRLPTELANVEVRFDGVPGALFFTNSQQINVQAPFELAGKSTSSVEVRRQGIPSSPISLSLRGADPGVFLSAGRPTIFNVAGSQIKPDQPAVAGDVLVMYATGLGALDAALGTGVPAPSSPLLHTAAAASVTVAGKSAEVQYSGLAPGFVGLYQVNFKVPVGVPAGDAPLILAIAGSETAPLLLAVR